MNVRIITLADRERVRQKALLAVRLLTLRQTCLSEDEFAFAIRYISRGGYTLEQIGFFAGRKNGEPTVRQWLDGKALPQGDLHGELCGIYSVLRHADATVHRRAARLG